MVGNSSGAVGGLLRLHVIASGSKGNAAIVENRATGQGVLIDCGVTKKAFLAGCETVGFDVRNLCGAVVTHDHSDHTKGVGVCLRGLAKLGVRIPLYTAPAIVAASRELAECRQAELFEYVPMAAGDALSLGGMLVHPFETSHDAAASFGFRFEARANGASDVLGYITDSGVVTPAAHEGLSGARILALESNHDVDMLRTGPYPYILKVRVGGDRGHLSNDQAASELKSLLHGGLESVCAMHVSQNNNTYRLPAESLRAVLSQEGHGASVQVAYQEAPVTAG